MYIILRAEADWLKTFEILARVERYVSLFHKSKLVNLLISILIYLHSSQFSHRTMTFALDIADEIIAIQEHFM